MMNDDEVKDPLSRPTLTLTLSRPLFRNPSPDPNPISKKLSRAQVVREGGCG